MHLDMTELLESWPHESGTLQARIIRAADGSRKLQVRLDLGIIQMELDGRPDGRTPHGYASLLEYFMDRHEKDGSAFSLTADDCAELQAEGIQFYHRYVSLLHLEEFDLVVRDTQRNLEMFDFVENHCNDEETASSLTQFRPYVLMVNTRAHAALAADRENMGIAMEIISEGRRRIFEAYGVDPDTDDNESIPELTSLDEWAAEFLMDRPLSESDRLQREMDIAIENEAYERAAELRDELRELENKESS